MSKISDRLSSEHYFWGDQCEGWRLVDNSDLSIIEEVMPAGASEKWHIHHKASQFFFILKGIATFEFENKKTEVEPLKGIRIEAGEKHRIVNYTTEELHFLVISQPTTRNDRINLEE